MRTTALRCSAMLAVMAAAARLQAQQDMAAVLERLERLERQNRELIEEVRALRAEVSGRNAGPPAEATLDERLSVQERRVEEQAQAKVESGRKVPMRVTGVVLFNAFLNTSRFAGTADYPTAAALTPGPRTSGGSLRQSTIGFEFDGGETIGGGKLSGALQMDFFAGTNSTLNHVFRIRTASARAEWGRTALVAGQEKPIFSPRDPTSLAQVGVSPLTNAGNPWLWQPQVRVERRFDFGEETSLRAQVGVLQTNETAATVPAAFAATLERARPALEGRFELRRGPVEIAPGFHFSTTHVAGTNVPSRALSIDWMVRPVRRVQLTGLAFAGANIANLGTLRQGFTILGPGRAIPIRSRGGWAQVEVAAADRVTLHVMAGQQDDHDRDLRLTGIGKNLAYAANVMYRLAPNFVIALEGGRVRTSYVAGPVRRNEHYDLAFAYLF